MTHQYRAVAWNTHKKVYDAILAGAIALYIALFAGLSLALAERPPDLVVVLIRAFGSAALILLHVVLLIGPLARFTEKAAPLLYNRRHAGVTLFLLALVHAGLVLFWYGAFGPLDPLSAQLFLGASFSSVETFPFQLLGFAALVWLFLMAATSHDFWLARLSPPVWKALHMGVYAVYILLLGHVALGAYQDPARGALPFWLLGAGALLVGGAHAAAGVREIARDSAAAEGPEGVAVSVVDPEGETDLPPPIDEAADPEPGWVDIGGVDEIPESRAKVVCLPGRERVAVYKHNGRLYGVTNVCPHQNGPLGEGKIVDGCITCPWHGYQFRPEDGCSPPPYTETVETFPVRVEGLRVLLRTTANPRRARVDAPLARAGPADTVLFEEVSKSPVGGQATADPEIPPFDPPGNGPTVTPDDPTSA